MEIKKIIITAVFSVIAFLLIFPLSLVLLLLPFFANNDILLSFLAGYLAIFIICLTLFVILKLALKQIRYAFLGVGLFFAIIAIFYGIGRARQINTVKINTVNKVIAELNVKESVAKQAVIEITDFQDYPTFDSKGVLTKINFKITFTSNTTADMGIYPGISLLANHYTSGQEFRFSLDANNAKYGDINRDKHGANTVFAGRNEVEFGVSNFMAKIGQYTVGNNGRFEVKTGFQINHSDPYGFGQGNATSIDNVVDKTGKVTVDTSVNKLGNVYLTRYYKIR